jgi:biopolymer transport protein TolR
MQRRVRRQPMSEINVVPYIDVMLVLLLIFMVTTPLLSQGVKIELPKAEAQAIRESEKEPIIVSVDAQGLYYLNIAKKPQQPISELVLTNQVTAELRFAKQLGQPRLVLVKGDQQVDYGKVVKAMVLLQQAGAETVGLLTAPEPDTEMAGNTHDA